MDMTTSHLPVKKTEDTWKRGATLEEAIKRVQKRSLAQHRVPLEKCRMDDEGRLVVEDQPYSLTQTSARSLLEKLDIPASFALKTCPKDLAVSNINRMMELKGKETVACWCDPKDNTVQNVTSEHFAPIRHLSFLEAFVEAYGLNGAHEVRMGSTELRVVRLFELKKDPVPGDYFQFGVEFTNYDIFSESRTLNAGAFLYRLTCKNGAKVNDLVADYSRLFKPPVNEIYLRDQIKQISFDSQYAEDVVATLQWMSRQSIGANRLPLYASFKKTAGKSLPLPKEPPFQEEDTYYDVYNHVTQAIQNPAMLFQRRLEVEAWAGSMVYSFHASLKAHARHTPWSGLTISMG